MNSIDRFLFLGEPLGLAIADKPLPYPIGYTPPVIIDIVNQERKQEPLPMAGTGRKITVQDRNGTDRRAEFENAKAVIEQFAPEDSHAGK